MFAVRIRNLEVPLNRECTILKLLQTVIVRKQININIQDITMDGRGINNLYVSIIRPRYRYTYFNDIQTAIHSSYYQYPIRTMSNLSYINASHISLSFASLFSHPPPLKMNLVQVPSLQFKYHLLFIMCLIFILQVV